MKLRAALDDFFQEGLGDIECKDESLAVQSQRDESDINKIMERFGQTGRLPENVRVPTFQDFADVFDYQSAANLILEAGQAFMAMPAKVRNRFNNDPGAFISFVDDPANLEEAVALGIAVRRPEATKEPLKGAEPPVPPAK